MVVRILSVVLVLYVSKEINDAWRFIDIYTHLFSGLCIREIVAEVKVTGSELVIGSEFPCIQIIYKHGMRMTWAIVGS